MPERFRYRWNSVHPDDGIIIEDSHDGFEMHLLKEGASATSLEGYAQHLCNILNGVDAP